MTKQTEMGQPNEAAQNNQTEIKGEKLSQTNSKRQKKTIMLAKMGMLAAISIILVYLVRFPIFPTVPFLEYDPADIPILLGTFAFGPAGGILLTVVVSIIQGVTVSAGSQLYGIIMHIIATGVLALVAGLIYRKKKTRKSAVIGLITGTIAMAVVMFFANMIITPMFIGLPLSAVMQLMPFIIAFNLIKAGINATITFIVYKRISKFLHK